MLRLAAELTTLRVDKRDQFGQIDKPIRVPVWLTVRLTSQSANQNRPEQGLSSRRLELSKFAWRSGQPKPDGPAGWQLADRLLGSFGKSVHKHAKPRI